MLLLFFLSFFLSVIPLISFAATFQISLAKISSSSLFITCNVIVTLKFNKSFYTPKRMWNIHYQISILFFSLPISLISSPQSTPFFVYVLFINPLIKIHNKNHFWKKKKYRHCFCTLLLINNQRRLKSKGWGKGINFLCIHMRRNYLFNGKICVQFSLCVKFS